MPPDRPAARAPTWTQLTVAALIVPLGIVWHDLAGHALMAIQCGGRITRLKCLGVELVPGLSWTGSENGLGAVDAVDLPTRTGEALTQIAGSLGTLIVAAVAVILLLRVRPRGVARAALLALGAWSLDLFTAMLPSVGLRRYVLAGTTESEPYDAALALGIPGPIFQVLAIGGSLAILAGLVVSLRGSPTDALEPAPRGRRRRAWPVLVTAVLVLFVYFAAIGVFAHSVPDQAFAQAPATNWVRDPARRVQEWTEDVDALANELERRHRNAFFQCRREDFEAAAAALCDAVPTLRDDQVVVGMMKLVASIGDSHTSIDAWSLRPGFHSFPLAVYNFSDGPVIYAARESQMDLIGCTLVKFGEAAVDEAFRRVAATSACENEPTFLDAAPRLLVVPELACAVGLIPSIERAEIVVKDRDGVERAVELTPLAPGENLVGHPMDAAKQPLSRRRNPRANWFEVLSERKTLYLRYNTCADEPDQSVAALSSRMLEAIDSNGLDRVIVDLRGNGGGNSGHLTPFLHGLEQRSDAIGPGRIYVLIGRRTFSSAHMNATYLKEELGGTLIGEPTGQKPNGYGEVRRFVLPHSQIVVNYSTKYFRLANGDPPYLAPDRNVSTSSADYFEMRDPVLDAALE